MNHTRNLFLSITAAALSSCTPAHADQIIWINDNAGQVVGQAAITGNVVWFYDAQGTPTGNASILGAPTQTLRAPPTAFFPPESALRPVRGLRTPAMRPQDMWLLDDDLEN